MAQVDSVFTQVVVTGFSPVLVNVSGQGVEVTYVFGTSEVKVLVSSMQVVYGTVSGQISVSVLYQVLRTGIVVHDVFHEVRTWGLVFVEIFVVVEYFVSATSD